jgi:hypothetical protein
VRKKRSKEEVLRKLRGQVRDEPTTAEPPEPQKVEEIEEKTRPAVVWFDPEEEAPCPRFFEHPTLVLGWCRDEGVTLVVRDGEIVASPSLGSERVPSGLRKEINFHREELLQILTEGVIKTMVRRIIESSPEWRHSFAMLCEDGEVRLAAQAWQFREEIQARGHTPPPHSVEDALFDLARELCPDSPAADEGVFSNWATELWRQASHHYGKAWKRAGSPTRFTANENSEACWGSRAEYRAEVRRWLEGELAALREAREGAA